MAVAELGSVAAAARHVRVAQPSVSRQLRSLEKELGVNLFERGQGALSLSPAGERFLGIAEDLVSRYETATRLFSSDSSEEMRFLVVAQATTERRVIAPFTATFGAKYPRTDVLNESPQNVFATVDSVHADIGVSTIAPPTGWSAQYLAEVPLIVQVPTTHPLAGRQNVDIRELPEYALILMASEHSARRVLDQVIAENGVRVGQFIESQSSTMAQAAAAAGRGAAVVTDEAQFGLYSVPITDHHIPLSFPLYAGWKRHHYASLQISTWAQELAQWAETNPALKL